MNETDSGHSYQLHNLDGEYPANNLTFVKRVGEGYPGNAGPAHPGTNCQEVIRTLIARVKYLQGQIPDVSNQHILWNLRSALYQFEDRAARRHGRVLDDLELPHDIENVPPCPLCGHIQCGGKCR